MLSNLRVDKLLTIILITQSTLLHAIERDRLLEITSEGGSSLEIRIFLSIMSHKIHIFTFL